MSKEEFLSLISSEIEKLEKEKELIQSRIEYYNEVGIGGEDLKDAKRQMEVINNKIERLKEFINLPAVTRIQAMSSIELEEYKKEKVEELELHIKDLEAQDAQKREELSQLKAQQAASIERFAHLSGDEREQAISEGRLLASRISEFDAVFEEIRKEIEETRKQQEQMKGKDLEEIRKELFSKVPNGISLATKVEYIRNNPLSYQNQLLAAVANDPEKTKKMAELLSSIASVDYSIYHRSPSRFFLPYQLPKKLADSITTWGYVRDKYLMNADGVERELDKFLVIFEKKRKMFEEEYTMEKLGPLNGHEYGNDSEEVDFGFLELHRNKITKGNIEQLHVLVEHRDKLRKKLIKTKNTKDEIYDLNKRIRELQNNVYKEIVGWYCSQNLDILGIRTEMRFSGIYPVSDFLENQKKELNDSLKAIEELRDRLKTEVAEQDRLTDELEKRRADLARQMIELSGLEAKKDFVPEVAPQGDRIGTIQAAGKSCEDEQIITRVQQEAQVQADTREAELRNITMEQLLEMKKQLLENPGEQKTEEAGEKRM